MSNGEQGMALPQEPWRERLQALRLCVWLRGYRGVWLGADLLAGLTLAAYLIPEAIAYASLAGLSPQTGLYACLFGGIGYALLGPSPRIAVGPTASASVLIAGTLASTHVAAPAQAAQAIALLAGGLAVIAWLVRGGQLVNFISEPVQTGFKAGAALYIGATQLPALLGLPAGGGDFASRLGQCAAQLGHWHPPAAALGLGTLALLWLLGRCLPGRPLMLPVLIAAGTLVAALDLPAHGVAVVGMVGSARPVFGPPDLDLDAWRELLPGAMACLLVLSVEGLAVARVFAGRDGRTLHPDRELLALGVGNLLVGLFGGYPAGGGMSQSAVNDRAGARTPLALLVAAAVLAAALFGAAPLLRWLAAPMLAAVVLVAVSGMIDLSALRRLRRVSRNEFGMALVALFAVLLLGVLRGVLVAALVSLLGQLRRTAHPHLLEQGWLADSGRYVDHYRHPEAQRPAEVLVLRPDRPPLYYNAESLRLQLRRALDGRPVRAVVLDLAVAGEIDLSAADMLGAVAAEFAARGVRLWLADVRGPVRDLLERAGFAERFPELRQHLALADAVSAARAAQLQ